MFFDLPCTLRHPAAFTCNNPALSKSRAHDIFLSILPDTYTSDFSRLGGWRQRWCYSSDSRGFVLVAAVTVNHRAAACTCINSKPGLSNESAPIRSRYSLPNQNQRSGNRLHPSRQHLHPQNVGLEPPESPVFSGL
ncbi:hypothetical protein ABIE61_001812 [Marinobacterium sp. MBR-111]|uniref:hypothetical protein n=1 Tax=Marinobacterium sp. MBR-111 TaxID=3156463 RepID=UPI003395052A